MLRPADTRVLTIIGARPQFVKAAMLSRQFAARKGVREILLHTGQHYDHKMSDVFFQQLQIPAPEFQLNIGSGPHGRQTAMMLEGIERVLLQQRPDWVLVYGDTNTTLAGALASSKLHVPVAHVEAGLRSGNRRMPEEVNRVVVDHLSQLLFAPSAAAVNNLVREGIDPQQIHEVGDVMYDAVLAFAEAARRQAIPLSHWNLSPQHYVLVTVHRAENTDSPPRFRALVTAFKELARKWRVLWPIHPRAKSMAEKLNLLKHLPANLQVVAPVGYLEMLQLQSHAALIATDSGGVQKEAFYLQVPCLTLRDETEWTETVQAGWNRLVAAEEFNRLPELVARWRQKSDRAALPEGLHGGGRAAASICELLLKTDPTF